MQNLVMQTDSW